MIFLQQDVGTIGYQTANQLLQYGAKAFGPAMLLVGVIVGVTFVIGLVKWAISKF